MPMPSAMRQSTLATAPWRRVLLACSGGRLPIAGKKIATSRRIGWSPTAAKRIVFQTVKTGFSLSILSVLAPLRYHLEMNKISFTPFIIGVAGGSGSGKSTVTQQVLASFGAEMVSVVMQDDYYCDQSELSPELRRKQNYDHPQAFDWPLLVQHVEALRNGEAIEMPEYDFTIDNRSNKTIPVKPAPVIVIEGLFALYDADLRNKMSLKIFVDTASDIRFIRRMQRDITERGRSVESVVGQYLETVRPMHKQFIEPTKRHADVIFPHGANGPAVDVIVTKVASVIGQLNRPF
ncbi:uridine kinase [Massilia glaciei]|uniref:uridine kinase n=1 Tax=Massilia glaciei TaxID=1524097 RepID=UPI001E4BA7E8|nr:uridine kinase [Massilia glaciei]